MGPKIKKIEEAILELEVEKGREVFEYIKNVQSPVIKDIVLKALPGHVPDGTEYIAYVHNYECDAFNRSEWLDILCIATEGKTLYTHEVWNRYDEVHEIIPDNTKLNHTISEAIHKAGCQTISSKYIDDMHYALQ